MDGATLYPNANSVRGRILAALLSGDKLTPLDTLKRFGAFRLAADIHELRRRGWPIQKEGIIVETRDAGRKATVARYHIDQNDITAAGDAGRRFGEFARLVEISRRWQRIVGGE